MRSEFLIDSHIFLWLLQDPAKVNTAAIRELQSAQRRYVSLATIWELGIKHRKGKLAFSAEELLDAVSVMGLDLLEISGSHIIAATTLRISHKNPFDCLLLAQAQVDGLHFLTADKAILRFSLPSVIDAGRQ